MILIRYNTSAHYEESICNIRYCKSLTSAKRALRELFFRNETKREIQKEILKQFDKWVFDKKTCMSVGSANIESGDLYIHIEEINLI